MKKEKKEKPSKVETPAVEKDHTPELTPLAELWQVVADLAKTVKQIETRLEEHLKTGL